MRAVGGSSHSSGPHEVSGQSTYRYYGGQTGVLSIDCVVFIHSFIHSFIDAFIHSFRRRFVLRSSSHHEFGCVHDGWMLVQLCTTTTTTIDCAGGERPHRILIQSKVFTDSSFSSSTASHQESCMHAKQTPHTHTHSCRLPSTTCIDVAEQGSA